MCIKWKPSSLDINEHQSGRLLELYIPIEASGEEATTRRGSQECPRFSEPGTFLLCLIVVLAGSASAEVKLILLVPLMCEALVDNGGPVEVTDTTEEVRGDGLGERLERLGFGRVVVWWDRDRILEALVVGFDERGNTGVQCCSC